MGLGSGVIAGQVKMEDASEKGRESWYRVGVKRRVGTGERMEGERKRE